MPPLFLAPALQNLRPVTSPSSPNPNPPSLQIHHHHQHRPFSATTAPQIRLRNREKNKTRGVSAIRRTGPRVPLSVAKYTLPEPVWHPAGRDAFKTREDHGLYGFFNEARTSMTLPEDLDAHGRAWTEKELANKNWDDLWKIWWKCVRERNWLSSDAAERKRMDAGYGEGEFVERDMQVSFF
jgi:large subunit ribosomal protein L47